MTDLSSNLFSPSHIRTSLADSIFDSPTPYLFLDLTVHDVTFHNFFPNFIIFPTFKSPVPAGKQLHHHPCTEGFFSQNPQTLTHTSPSELQCRHFLHAMLGPHRGKRSRLDFHRNHEPPSAPPSTFCCYHTD